MPHTARSCNDPYASKINPIFAENHTLLVDLSEPDPKDPVQEAGRRLQGTTVLLARLHAKRGSRGLVIS